MPENSTDLRLPLATILKILAAALVVAAVIQLWSFILLFYIAVLLAVTLDPAVEWLSRKRLPRWVGVLLMAVGVLIMIALFFFVVLPPLANQIQAVAKELPKLREQLLSKLPHGEGGMVPEGKDIIPDPKQAASGANLLKGAFTIGGFAVGGLSQIALILVLAIYLLEDGRSMKKWLIDFFSREKREKIEATLEEMAQVTFAYVAGQFITSLLVFFYAFAVLSVLKVPAALMLAILAGIFDILPILGFFMSTIPALALALTVSPKTALLVFIFYAVYHAVENYFIVPKVYGKRMRLSTLTVLLSLLAGAILAGIPGAIAILPVIASYPVVERIWLVDILGKGVVKKHLDQAEISASDDKKLPL